jgi:predicted AlkP superfamily phosphohydrolase/phosphomutase
MTACGQQVSEPGKKVLILGFDGMDAKTTKTMLDAGKLPNFAKLRDMGGFSPLATVLPPQSPVAWATFSTGQNPGSHNIFDFLSRDPETYLPSLSMADVKEPERTLDIGNWSIPLSSPKIKNYREGVPFWKVVSDNGIPVTVLRIPVNFPPDQCGHQLSGMGTPDMLGTMGTFSFFTNRPVDKTSETGGRIQEVQVQNNTVEAAIEGPGNPYKKEKQDLSVPLKVHIDPSSRSAEILLQDQRFFLKEGSWSNWAKVTFKLMPLASSTGIVRFYLKEVDPYFELYMSPINIDPENPALPVSYPEDYANELSDQGGLFYTQGMAEDTWALNQKRLNDEAFLEQGEIIFQEQLRSFQYEWKRFTSGLFVCYFSTTDPYQHMFYRYIDPEWPGYDPERAERFGKVIEETYIQMDKILGEVLSTMDSKTTAIVVSDHGFAPFRRAVHLNHWLMEKGYLTLSNPSREESGEFFENVDWYQTRAYAIGLNGLYLNLAGREKMGIVEPAEAESLKQELIRELELVVDPDYGKKMVSKVYRGDEEYSGPYTKNAPDLVVGYTRGYRGSWQTALGAAPAVLIEDNLKAWSGDHCIDPVLVPGILFSNKKIIDSDPGLIDIATTVLNEFSLSPLPAMTGKDVLE